MNPLPVGFIRQITLGESMKSLLRVAAAVFAVMVMSPAQAAIITYEATNAYPNHGIWLRPAREALGLGSAYLFSIKKPGTFIYDSDSG